MFLVLKEPWTPWYVKGLVAFIVGYALSPIDFIPDFIPVLGYLDDVILLPAAIALVIKIIPPDILADCWEKARLNPLACKPKIWAAAAVIVSIWLLILAYIWKSLFNY